MAISLQKLYDQANYILRSVNDNYWTQDFFIEVVNEITKEIVRHRPDASYDRSDITTVDGALQTLPSDAIQLMWVDGVVESGNVVRTVKPRKLGELGSDKPTWVADRATSSSQVEFYAYQARTPRNFWISCPPPAGWTVRITHSVLPSGMPSTTADIATNSIDMSDEYFTTMLNGIIYRAYQRENAGANTIQYYRSIYLEMLASDEAADTMVHPMNENGKDEFSSTRESRKG